MTASAETPNQKEKPRLALAIATALGVGYAPKAPGTFGSLVGVVTIFLSAVFFLRPAHWSDLFSLHPLADSTLMDKHFLVPGSDIHDAAMWLPLICAFALLIFLALAGVWASHRTADYSGIKDPQFVVIDEVAGQHLTLVLPLIPIAMPNLQTHMDFSVYAIFSALSLVNWKYLLAGFLLFRLFDIWKPYPIKSLEKLPGGWGIMADDWLAGVYAAILLRAALHFGLV
ncbi:MAG TPA: phosphatidylglycerophosphatase A [Candidatus Angelobacter sp.]|nr:phosphatidylglycerophosphatase A [Candidatus Angelobacter sp.]